MKREATQEGQVISVNLEIVGSECSKNKQGGNIMTSSSGPVCRHYLTLPALHESSRQPPQPHRGEVRCFEPWVYKTPPAGTSCVCAPCCTPPGPPTTTSDDTKEAEPSCESSQPKQGQNNEEEEGAAEHSWEGGDNKRSSWTQLSQHAAPLPIVCDNEMRSDVTRGGGALGGGVGASTRKCCATDQYTWAEWTFVNTRGWTSQPHFCSFFSSSVSQALSDTLTRRSGQQPLTYSSCMRGNGCGGEWRGGKGGQAGESCVFRPKPTAANRRAVWHVTRPQTLAVLPQTCMRKS